MSSIVPTSNTSVAPVLLYDANNRPIPLSNEARWEQLMGSYDSYAASSFALAPYNADRFISAKGYDVLDDMLTMSAVRGPLNIIRDAVLFKGWTVVPAVNDKGDGKYAQAAEIARCFEYALNNIEDAAGNCYDFRQDIWELLYAIHMGFHVAEICWRIFPSGPFAGKAGFTMFAHKPCKQIGFELDLGTLAVNALTNYTPLNGYTFGIPVKKALRYTFAPRAGLPYGNGVGRMAYKHSWSLDFLYKFWNIALETFGSPFILGKAPSGSMKIARDVIQAIRQGAPAVLPTGVDAELVEVSGGGLAAFKVAADHHSQQLAQGYLGSTLTTGEGQRSGSLALGKVHSDTQEYGLGSRRADIENLIYFQLARQFVEVNYGPDALELTPRVSLGNWDEADMEGLSTAFQSLIDAQVMHPGEDVIRERLNLPPLSPDLKAVMEKVWADPSPQTVPEIAPTGGSGDANDDNSDASNSNGGDQNGDGQSQEQ